MTTSFSRWIRLPAKNREVIKMQLGRGGTCFELLGAHLPVSDGTGCLTGRGV